MEFRVASYNIHKGIGGLDRRYRPERIVEVIKHYRPHVLLMQEVDDGVPRSHRHRQVDFFADELGYPHRAFQANVSLRRGRYGNAILSRFPLRDVRNIDLTVLLKKRRRALFVRATIDWKGHSHTLVVVCTHLGLAGFERAIQLRRLLTHSYVHRVHRQTPLIIGGDFNDVWSTLGKTILKPAGMKSVCGPLKTFPAVMPLRSLDAIYYRGPINVSSAFVGHTELTKIASDHRPLIADFRLPF